MNLTANKEQFAENLPLFAPDTFIKERSLAMFAASITFGDEDLIVKALKHLQKNDIEKNDFYEIILQSYLFLGFPRMLTAALAFGKVFEPQTQEAELESEFVTDISNWVERGQELCRKIYKDKYQALRYKIAPLAPEIFEWMISEGYGKVLSRNQLDIKQRELCIVSTLILENRPSQILAHMRGAVNVGVSKRLIQFILEDLKVSAGDGYKNGYEIFKKVCSDR